MLNLSYARVYLARFLYSVSFQSKEQKAVSRTRESVFPLLFCSASLYSPPCSGLLHSAWWTSPTSSDLCQLCPAFRKMQSVQQKTKTETVTQTQSFTLVKNMFRAAFSSIAYVRRLFHDDVGAACTFCHPTKNVRSVF